MISRECHVRLRVCLPHAAQIIQIARAEPPYNAARSRLQSAETLERVAHNQHSRKKAEVDGLESKLAALKV